MYVAQAVFAPCDMLEDCRQNSSPKPKALASGQRKALKLRCHHEVVCLTVTK